MIVADLLLTYLFGYINVLRYHSSIMTLRLLAGTKYKLAQNKRPLRTQATKEN